MKNTANTIYILCFTLVACIYNEDCVKGQDSVTGQVFSIENKMPVPFATVYINNTTKGTITDSLGCFSLSNVIFPTEIVVSHVSYQSFSITVENDSVLPLSLWLEKDKKHIKEVYVLDYDMRQRNINLVKELLLGKDKWGKNSELLNSEELWFDLIVNESDSLTQFGLGNQFKAYADAPLQIDLPHFGYRLQFDLIEFKLYYDPALDKGIFTYTGFFYYKPDGREGWLRRIWIRNNRLKAYYNSPKHFFRSLYNNSLKENGYAVFDKFYSGSEKYKFDSVFSFDPYKEVLSGNQLKLYGLKGRKFYVEYYRISGKKPLNLNIRQSVYPIRSIMVIASDSNIIRSNGTSANANVVFEGPIGDKQLGAALPFDYQPGK